MRDILRQDIFYHPLLALAQKAGNAIMEIYKAPTQEVLHKDDASPLTRADLAAHALIWEGLTRHTPNIPIVCEENTVNLSSLDTDKLFWLVDPLDGTKEFLQRNGMFTVNIALIEQGYPVYGVIYAPALNTLYWGAKGWGAWQGSTDNPTLLKVSALSTPPRLLVSKNHLNQETSDFLDRFITPETLQMGSSLKFCAISAGKADIYPRFAPTSQWDTAAGQAILEGAGGHVYTGNGQRLSYGQPSPLNPSFIAASVPYGAL